MTRSTQSIRTLSLLAVIALAGSSCKHIGLDQPEPHNFGSIVVEGKTTSATTVSATAKGIFFSSTAASVPSSITAQTDQCSFFNVDTTTSPVEGQIKAGDALTLQVGSSTQTMVWEPVPFRYSVSTPFTYTSGTTAQLTVPGAGTDFPAGSVSVLLAEPLLAPAITLPTSGPLTVNWNAGTSTSAVLLNLQYGSTPGATYANEQVICSLKDDGQTVIPANNLATFYASPPALRKLLLTRFRTSEVQINDKTLLHISSQVDTAVVLH